jgi:hypothetical protein
MEASMMVSQWLDLALATRDTLPVLTLRLAGHIINVESLHYWFASQSDWENVGQNYQDVQAGDVVMRPDSVGISPLSLSPVS